MSGPIPFFRHDLGQSELDAVARVFAGPMLTTGDTVAGFELRFARYLGSSHALGVTSCTGALHLSLLGLGIGPGDEVITSPLTFVATATAIEEAGATPVFVDVEAETGNLDASRIKSAITSRTKAIIPVHLYGQMCDMLALRALADRHRLHLIEDCAHCIEGSRDGVRPGEVSATACFSFYATKNMTCGEGGAIVCNDADLHARLRLLRLHGMTRTAADRQREGYAHWDVATLGWKYNMDNIQAAILMPQLERIEANHQLRQRVAAQYEDRLRNVPGIQLMSVRPGVRHARHLFTVLADPGERDPLISSLRARQIEVVVNYRAIHLLTYFREKYGYRRGDFPHAEHIGDRTLSLPFYPAIPLEHVDAVAAAISASQGLRAVA